MINYLEEPHFAHHHHGGEIEHTKLMAAQYYTSLLSQLTSHKHNTDVHVSNEDREKWDNKADKTSLYELEQLLIYKADKKDIPTLISELQNDVPYLKGSELDSILSQYGYITYADLGNIDWSRYITGNFVSESELATRLQGYLLISELYNRVHNLGFITEDDVSGSTFDGFVKRSELNNYIQNSDILFYNNGTAVRKGDYIETGSGGEGTGKYYRQAFKTTSTADEPNTPNAQFPNGGDGWKLYAENPDASKYVWMCTQLVSLSGQPLEQWNGPWLISGQPGEPGQPGTAGKDGEGIEYVYTRTRTDTAPSANLNAEYGTEEFQDDDFVPVGWNDTASGVTEEWKYEWVGIRTSSNGTWSTYAGPLLWSHYGQNGVDGDGVEYIFYAARDGRIDGAINYPQNWTSSTPGKDSKTFQDDEFIALNSDWQDNPIDLGTNTYGPGSVQWVSMRKKQNGVWQSYSAPAVWSRLGEDGVVDGYTIDLSNENMPVGTDAEGNASNYSNSTLVQAFYNGSPLIWESTASTPSSGHFTYTIGTITRSDGAASTNIAATSNGATIAVTINSTGITNFDEVNAYVPVTITLPNGTTRDVNITLFGVATGEAGQAVDLYTSCSVIRTDASKTTATPSTISMGVKIGRGDNVTTYLSGSGAEDRGYTFKYVYDDATIDGRPNQAGNITLDGGNHSSITIVMYKNSVLIDSETIPFVADGNTGASVLARYAPTNTPTPSHIHTTWLAGDIYMQTKSTTDSDWSPWYRIVGETGGETNYSFGISAQETTASVSTSPSDISPSNWSDAPVATTTQKPYLWARVQKKDGNGNNIGSPSYIRLTGEKGEPGAAFVVDIDNQMSQVGIDSDRVVINDFETTTQLRAFYGSQEITNECTFAESHDDSDILVDVYNSSTATSANPIGSTRIRVLSTNILSEESSIITYTITHPTYAPNGRTITFTLLAIAPGVDGNSTTYEILPSLTQVRASRDANGNYVPANANITCGYIKNDGGTITNVTDVTSAFDGYELYFRLHNRSTNTWSNYTKYRTERSMATGFALNVNDKIEYIICTNTANSITESQITGLRDRETVPVVSDGLPGSDGQNAAVLEILGRNIVYKGTTGGYVQDTSGTGWQLIRCYASLKVAGQKASISTNDISFQLPTNWSSSGSVTISVDSLTDNVATLLVRLKAGEYIDMQQGYITVTVTGTRGGNTYTASEAITITPAAKGDTGLGGGQQGKPGKFYYYAGEYAASNTTMFTVTEHQAPYVKYNDEYWIFIADVEFSDYSYSQMLSGYGYPSGSNSNWEKMTSQFKYLITEATFSDYAKMGSAIFSGDWMISQYGTNVLGITAQDAQLIEDLESDANVSLANFISAMAALYDPDNGSYDDTNTLYTNLLSGHSDSDIKRGIDICYKANDIYVNGSKMTFTQLVSMSDHSYQLFGADSNDLFKLFTPNIALDMLTGKAYFNDAEIRGTVRGSFAGDQLIIDSTNYTAYRVDEGTSSYLQLADVTETNIYVLYFPTISYSQEGYNVAYVALPEITEEMIGKEITICNASVIDGRYTPTTQYAMDLRIVSHGTISGSGVMPDLNDPKGLLVTQLCMPMNWDGAVPSYRIEVDALKVPLQHEVRLRAANKNMWVAVGAPYSIIGE